MAKTKSPTLTRLVERATAPFSAGVAVNREAGTIGNVLICGFDSANGRTYPAEVFRRDYRAYEGARVNCDHARDSTVDRRLGWFSDVRVGEDGKPRGTLHVLKSHPMADRVFEAAERNPSLYGFSHVAMCETKQHRGKEIVEAIKSVESIDLVADAATTRSLFEGINMPVKLSEYVAQFVRHPKATTEQIVKIKRLAEMEGMGDMAMPADTPAPTEETDPAAGISDAFKTACMHVIQQALDGDLDPKEALSKIKSLLGSHADVNGSGDSSAADDSSSSDDSTDPMPESKQKRADPWAVLSECQALEYAPTPAELELLASQPDSAKRKIYVTEQKAKAANAKAEKSKSAGRTPGAAPGGKKVAESFPKTLAELREHVAAHN